MAIDDNTVYGLYGSQIKDLAGKIKASGGVTELTSADYNWPTNNPTAIATWLLDDGIYKNPSALTYVNNSQTRAVGQTFVKSTTTDGWASTLSWSGTNNSTHLGLYITNPDNGRGVASYSVPEIVQSTGTSTTSVMSQNATTSMVFADPSRGYNVQIGHNASANGDTSVSIGYGSAIDNAGYAGIAIGNTTIVNGNQGIAIGNAARITNSVRGAIALGSNSQATRQGEMNIGSSDTARGFNDSNYRLISGVYDGQSAHDAATKGQLDSAVSTLETELDAKQDILTAGQNITIAEESGALVISATGGSGADVFTTNEWNALWA